jgi:hypothetical protein
MIRRGLTSERLIGLFLFGMLLFMPPLIGVFDRSYLVGGIPLLYLYLFLAWAMVIAALMLIVERPLSKGDPDEDEPVTGADADLDQTKESMG